MRRAFAWITNSSALANIVSAYSSLIVYYAVSANCGEHFAIAKKKKTINCLIELKLKYIFCSFRNSWLDQIRRKAAISRLPSSSTMCASTRRILDCNSPILTRTKTVNLDFIIAKTIFFILLISAICLVSNSRIFSTWKIFVWMLKIM